MSRIVIINNTSVYVLRFRRHLIADLVALGHEVVLISPRDPAWTSLSSLGIECVELPLAQHGTDPVAEARALWFLVRELRRRRPDYVVSFTIKPATYGSIAARLAGVSQIASVFTGLGYYFTDDQAALGLSGKMVRMLLRFALPLNHRLIFQNTDDRDLMVSLGLVCNEQARIVRGSGVDVEHFSPREACEVPGTFLLIGRMLKEKGVREFVEAARNLRVRYPEARFLLLGGIDGSRSAISIEELLSWQNEGLVEYLGEQTDVRDEVAGASVVVLPSYREGLPRAVLEALSMAKAVITTDAPGCRETVAHGINGYLVPPRDASALARAMEEFLRDPLLARRMGLESRRIVERDFDVRAVNKSFLSALNIQRSV